MTNSAKPNGLSISRGARERYGADAALTERSDRSPQSSVRGARLLAQRMNQRRNLSSFPEQAIKAGQIGAAGLLNDVLLRVIEAYCEQAGGEILRRVWEAIEDEVGADGLNETLTRFVEEFPPPTVRSREQSSSELLAGKTGTISNRDVALQQLLVLWLANLNPAFTPLHELFDDSAVTRGTAYRRVIEAAGEFLATQPPFGPDGQPLLDMLRSPAVAVPHSLHGQLEFIRERWGYLLGSLLGRLLSAIDLIAEEDRARSAGPGPAQVARFKDLDSEPEGFSPDSDWMPRAILMAKNTYVWLDQLSRRYERSITRLDQIPDEELDTLAGWGFTGLWLIGLWQRSAASQRIKQLCGNPDAVASAYSLDSYAVAHDLGGEEAFTHLKHRCWQRGIRMATDMVPNHMGIDSGWVMEHPDWFISLNDSPFPAYSFSGPDLSHDERVGIFIEDHYYDRSDAAVVFKRVDRWTGSERFLYHGNDGTTMPWNDTAQLDYRNAEVREAVIQTILEVARKSPIIRFDAAMTLAKRHYQRLWFPEPGGGGAIPSRAEHGLTKQQLDHAMPEEFWREVVDRVAAEVPDTLLLAEAFWLMEGYFVRTLGMHRVYNSAFMNMLRDEDNASYRQVMKNTLQFDPQILRRFVNFMSNPDERTAVDQFGKGDKYFGIATLMATLPGLPMFGHGQIEGFTEKYGMEYRRAYWDEDTDDQLLWRHQQEVFPLLHRRHLFAGVEHFRLYDFVTAEGHVNEDVFAYSNRSGDDRAVVIFHNRFGDTRGWVHSSVAWESKPGGGSDTSRVQTTMAKGLELHEGPAWFTILRDQASGLEYIRSNQEIHERGLFVELGAYKSHVFIDLVQVQDDEQHRHAELTALLDGRGVASIQEALKEMFFRPLHETLRKIVSGEASRRLAAIVAHGKTEQADSHNDLLDTLLEQAGDLYAQVERLGGRPVDTTRLSRRTRDNLEALVDLAGTAEDGSRPLTRVPPQLQRGEPLAWALALSWILCRRLGTTGPQEAAGPRSRSVLDEWLLADSLATPFAELASDQGAASHAVDLLKLLVLHQRWFTGASSISPSPAADAEHWLADSELQAMLQVNRYKGTLWFNREALHQLLDWMSLVAAIDVLTRYAPDKTAPRLAELTKLITRLEEAAEESEYRLEEFVQLIQG